MKRIKRVIGLALCMALVLSALLPTTLKANPRYDKTATYSWWGNSYNTTLYIGSLSQNELLDPASVKSSNTKVVEIDYKRLYEYTDPSSDYSSANLGIIIKKKGKSVISFNLGSKTHKITVKVGNGSSSSYNYSCPVKTFTVSSVNSGKNLAGKFKKTGYVYNGIKWQETDNATLKIQSKSGWVVSSVDVYEYGNVFHRSRYYNFDQKGNLTLNLGELTKVKEGQLNISVSFRKGNEKNSKYENLTLSLR